MEAQEPVPERLGPPLPRPSPGRPSPGAVLLARAGATTKDSTPPSNTLMSMGHLNGTPVSQATRGPRSSTPWPVRAGQA